MFDEIFVQPASGDDGCAVGACLLAHSKQVGPLPIKKAHNFYKGSRFTEDEITADIVNSGIVFHQPDNLYEYVAQSLAKGAVNTHDRFQELARERAASGEPYESGT